MRGNLWAVAVAAVFTIFLMAIDAGRPATPSQHTDAVISVLHTISPVAKLVLMLVTIGAALAISTSRGF